MVMDENIYNRPEVRRSSTLSIVDLTLANLMVTLTSGAFLQGYAINILGASDAFIGLMLALPGIMAIFQLFTPWVVLRVGSRKKASIYCGLAGRLLWLFIPLLAYYPFTLLGEVRRWALLFLLTLSALFLAICNGVTFSWIGDLVSPRERGDYFGRRSMAGGFLVLLASFISARFLDRFNGPFGFTCVFTFAIIAGLAGIVVKVKMVEPQPLSPSREGRRAGAALRRSLLDRGFRPLLFFIAAWNFSVMLGAAFFSPFLVGDLHMSYTLITVATIMGNIAVTGFSGFWGKAIDRFGSRPVILFTSFFKIFMPGLWIWITPENPAWLIGTQLLNLFNQGITIGTNKLLLELSPDEERDAYVATYNAIAGLMAALAPAMGGLLLPFFSSMNFELLGAGVSHYKVLFIISSFLRAFAILPLLFIREPGAMTVRDMLRKWRITSAPADTIPR